MSATRAYFDWNASAPLLPEARDAMVGALNAANPSSVHSEGRAARRLIERARAEVAALAGAKAENVVFTSGATEAAATLLTPDWRMARAPLLMSRLYICEADHPCLLSGGRFSQLDVCALAVDSNGVLKVAELEQALAAHESDAGLPLVAIHLANNETGVVQPAAEIAAIVRRYGGVPILDAVQAAGRISLDLVTLDCDFLILSAHKIGGPKGVGAIIAKSDLMMPTPLIIGGAQERGFRAGTENVAGIAGFGAAAVAVRERLGDLDPIRARRDRIERAIRARLPDAVIFGSAAHRLVNTCFFAIPGMKAETLQIAFDMEGFAVSAGSACSSGKVGPSHVLRAMGFQTDEGAIRVSIGLTNTDDEIGRFETALAEIAERRKLNVSRAARAA